MTLKYCKPTTPGQRGLVQITRIQLYKGKPAKELLEGLKKKGGRNNCGRVTARRRGGGHKRRYRLIDFGRRKFGVSAWVKHLEYDPNRSSPVALLEYDDGIRAYILAPQKLQIGDRVISGRRVDIRPGNAMPLKDIPIGTIIHNIERKPGAGGRIARSAGNYAQLIGKSQGYAQLRLSSGEMRMFRSECMATVGAVSNADHHSRKLGKAGRKRWFGKRPSVRGVVMNPVDHPHGGGEGRTSGGRHPVTPWGKPTKGARTRGKKMSDMLVISRRRRKGR